MRPWKARLGRRGKTGHEPAWRSSFPGRICAGERGPAGDGGRERTGGQPHGQSGQTVAPSAPDGPPKRTNEMPVGSRGVAPRGPRAYEPTGRSPRASLEDETSPFFRAPSHALSASPT